MKTRVSKTSAAALLAIVLTLNIAPSAFARSESSSNEPFGVRDRIVRFLHDVGNLLNPRSLADLLAPPGR
jgi:hypothetical protein